MLSRLYSMWKETRSHQYIYIYNTALYYVINKKVHSNNPSLSIFTTTTMLTSTLFINYYILDTVVCKDSKSLLLPETILKFSVFFPCWSELHGCKLFWYSFSELQRMRRTPANILIGEKNVTTMLLWWNIRVWQVPKVVDWIKINNSVLKSIIMEF